MTRRASRSDPVTRKGPSGQRCRCGRRLRCAVDAGTEAGTVNTYQEVDWKIVFDIATNRLGDFAEFAHGVESKLPE